MPLAVNSKNIVNVGVIDDTPDVRATVSDELKEAAFIPYDFAGPYGSTDELIGELLTRTDAAVCDLHLNQRNYASFSGAEVIYRCYLERLPSILVSRYTKADNDHIRRYRRWIPVALDYRDANPDSIANGFAICVREFEEKFVPGRRPWRTLIRVEDVEPESNPPMVFAIIPAWNPDEGVRFPLDIVPEEIRDSVKPDARIYAKVNIGAENQDELFFEDFEYRR
jgi:hypothetical protein